ncbi:MAG: DNA polymerase I [Planctomycetota bacterium]|jgi:DNA polymerase-1|nr:DNA polymerase I [Planctomycetota bacterium]MDP6989576.1 DNA polymerase I [Planctomycetota bacterium]
MRLFLLDGTALAYRAHFAMARSGLTTREGRPTGASYGFTMTLRRLLAEERPERIAVAFDPPGKTFRHEQFADYKATRQRMPEELVDQLDDVRAIVRGHGIPIFEVPGYEADDVIGTLATDAEARGWEVMLVSGDKDFMQLVSERVKIYNVFKPGIDLLIEDADAVREKFGCDPAHVIDVLAIMGDASDNVPGVKGIGEKGAIKLIERFGSVAGVLDGIDEIKGKAREHIERDREQLEMSLDLVTIRRDVPLDPGLDAVDAPEPDSERLRVLFGDLDFQSLVQRVTRGEQPSLPRDYVTVRDEEGLEAMIAELQSAGTFSVDTETTSLFPLEAELVGISFSAGGGRAFYVPFNLEPPVLAEGAASLLERLAPLLCDPDLVRIGQNYKYDALVLLAAGLRVPPADFDTMVASFCAAGSSRRHNLDDLALCFFDLAKIPTKEIIGTGKKQVTMAEVAVDKVAEYACEDADVTFRLREVLERELAESEAEELFSGLEMPLTGVLTAMEERGVRLDTELIAGLSVELASDLEEAVGDLHRLAGEEFNVNSTKALGALLFEKLRIQDAVGIQRPKRTKTGWSTDHQTLSEKYGEVEIVQRLLAYRALAKLKSTYVDSLPTFVNEKTGRIHCSFSQVAAATGRLASSDPNLQNIPVRTERGRRLREAFVPREADEHGEWVLLAADYSQVELRIMAHLSGDPAMVEAFEQGRDIHASTAAVVFGVEPDQVDRELRSRAKAINFGLLYGMGAARLARETGLTVVEARAFIERYFDSFPTVREWIDGLLETAREKGWVETLMGRRRRIPELTSSSPRARSFAENAAINTPVQGSAADIIKRAMIDLEARLEASPLAGRMLLQVHDELLLEVPCGELDETVEVVRACMEGAADLRVPLAVEFGWGANWLEAH